MLLDKIATKIDLFGQTVGLNFKGQPAITSKVGALFTVLAMGLSAAYGGAKLYQLVNMKDP